MMSDDELATLYRSAADEVSAKRGGVANLQEAHENAWKRFHAGLRAVAAATWGEAYRLGMDDERISESNIGIAGFGAKVEPARENPYREQQE